MKRRLIKKMIDAQCTENAYADKCYSRLLRYASKRCRIDGKVETIIDFISLNNKAYKLNQ